MNVELIRRMVLATLKHEGLKPSKEAQEITNKYLRGEINSEKAIENIKLLHGVE